MEKDKTEEIKGAIRKTTSQPGNHACRDDPEGICRVTSTATEDLIFVDNKNHPQCPYYVPFAYGGFCNYNARKELYKNYKV